MLIYNTGLALINDVDDGGMVEDDKRREGVVIWSI